MTDGDNKKGKSAMERHIHTVLLSIITVAICWGSNQLFILSIAMAKMQVAVEQLNQNSDNYVTKEYIFERTKASDAQFSDLDKRLTRAENKIETLRPLLK